MSWIPTAHAKLAGTLTPAQQRRLQQLMQVTVGSGGSGRDTARSLGAWMAGSVMDSEAGGSFVTAQGTLNALPAGRSNPTMKGKAEEREREREGSPESDEEVEDLLAIDVGEHKAPGNDDTIKTAHTEWSYGETPLPSRVLHLRHAPRTTAQPALSGPLALDLPFTVDPWLLVCRAGETLEQAFWRFVMPSVSGLIGLREGLTNNLPRLMALVSTAATTLKVVADNDNESHFAGSQDSKEAAHRHSPQSPQPGSRNPHLYAQETLYTLEHPRLADPRKAGAHHGSGPADLDLDLGPTLQPVFVKKRSGLPEWESKDEQQLQVQRQYAYGYGYGWRGTGMGMGMGGGMMM